VRFEEVDQLRMMWHGRYAGWLEDGREAFGLRYGVRYADFHDHAVIVPLKTLSIDYKRPLRYGETYLITASLSWSDAALLQFTYAITDAEGREMTLASTIQLMLSPEGVLLLEHPPFFNDFRAAWREGTLCP
jgi:acyl-CoA thioester hydrolase